MEMIKNNFYSECYNEQTALIQCNEHTILHKLTFNDVRMISVRITTFLNKYFNAKNQCVALAMDKNIYIPSIILSLQELQYSFVFISEPSSEKIIKQLNIKWVISLDIKKHLYNCDLQDSFNLLNKEMLQLWKTSIDTVGELDFTNIFCVMYTSGSTGDNKLIRIPHSCIQSNVLSLNKYFNLSSSDHIFWGTPLTFDPTLVELLLGIFCHATLIIVSKSIVVNPTYLYNSLFKVASVTFLQIVPSLFLRFTHQQIADILKQSTLKVLAFGGEPFPKEILGHQRSHSISIFNLYGVTELSCWATIYRISENLTGNDQIPLGNPLDETFVELLKGSDKLTSGIGEIYVGSKSRYCLINKRNFIESVCYINTGDLGELNNNNIFYKGRKDRVIKQFGQKIHLDHIESEVSKQTSLQCRTVYTKKYKKLLCFILINEYFDSTTKQKLIDKLRVKLLKFLDDKEIPDYIDTLQRFPLNSHGKISNKKLERLYENSLDIAETPRKELGDIFISILSQCLGLECEDILEQFQAKTFFELGGSSIAAMHMLSDLTNKIQVDVPGEFVTLLFNESISMCLNYLKKTKHKRKNEYVENIAKKIKAEAIRMEHIVWKYNLKGCVDTTPVAFKNGGSTYIAIGSFSNIFVILNSNGQEHLKFNFPQEIEAKTCISPCGNRIYIGCGNGSIYCIDLNLKQIVWEYSTSDKIKSCPYLTSTSLIIGSYDSFIYCLCKEKGTLIWKTKVNGSIRADIIYNEQLKLAYIATIKGICYALKDNGSISWLYKVDSPVFGSPCIANDNIIWITVTGSLCCISLMGDLKWKHDICSNTFSSLMYQENSVYVTCHGGYLYKLTTSDDVCQVSEKIQLNGEISTSPCIYKYGNDLYAICMCNMGVLYAINLYTKSVAFKFALPSESFSSPYVFNDNIYVGCRDNNIYCIDFIKAIEQ